MGCLPADPGRRRLDVVVVVDSLGRRRRLGGGRVCLESSSATRVVFPAETRIPRCWLCGSCSRRGFVLVVVFWLLVLVSLSVLAVDVEELALLSTLGRLGCVRLVQPWPTDRGEVGSWDVVSQLPRSRLLS